MRTCIVRTMLWKRTSRKRMGRRSTASAPFSRGVTGDFASALKSFGFKPAGNSLNDVYKNLAHTRYTYEHAPGADN